MIQTWPVRIMVRSASQNSARSAVETRLVENLLELVADHDEMRQALGIMHRIERVLLIPDAIERTRDRHRQRRRIA